MLDYQNFQYAIQSIKKFIKEQDKLKSVLKVISPSGTCICGFGNEFIDDYIKLLEISVNDKSDWINWFIFENDFGNKKLKVKLPNNEEYEISNEKMLYDICIVTEL